jgi:hypothetical protein
VITKKNSCKKKTCNCDCNKKTVAKNTGKKSAGAKKPVQKKLHAMKLLDCN